MSLIKRLKANWTNLVASALVLVGIMAPSAALASTSQPRDCDMNSIVYCGAYTKAEWADKVSKGDGHHTAADIQHIYYSEGRGISSSNFQSNQTVDGTVYKDGRVVVSGKTVATNAKSIGREYIDGSVKSGSVWMRPTSVSFAADSIQAWVNMDGGTFHYFVLKSCGNAGVATPVAQPTTTPTPTKTPTPTPTPKASFSCEALTPTQPDVDKHPSTYRFTVTPKAENTTITGYRFTFSNQIGQVVKTSADVPYVDKEVKTGSLTVKAQVLTEAGDTVLSDACSATVTAGKSPAPVTPTPKPAAKPAGEVLGATLPATGPESALGGMAGLAAIGYAGRAYVRSRKSLLSSLRRPDHNSHK